MLGRGRWVRPQHGPRCLGALGTFSKPQGEALGPGRRPAEPTRRGSGQPRSSLSPPCPQAHPTGAPHMVSFSITPSLIPEPSPGAVPRP